MQKAAEKMGLSYSKAWKMKKTAEQELGFALTERSSGGKDGGGSVVTEEGREMMQRYGNFLSALQTEADRLFSSFFSGFGRRERTRSNTPAPSFAVHPPPLQNTISSGIISHLSSENKTQTNGLPLSADIGFFPANGGRPLYFWTDCRSQCSQ